MSDQLESFGIILNKVKHDYQYAHEQVEIAQKKNETISEKSLGLDPELEALQKRKGDLIGRKHVALELNIALRMKCSIKQTQAKLSLCENHNQENSLNLKRSQFKEFAELQRQRLRKVYESLLQDKAVVAARHSVFQHSREMDKQLKVEEDKMNNLHRKLSAIRHAISKTQENIDLIKNESIPKTENALLETKKNLQEVQNSKRKNILGQKKELDSLEAKYLSTKRKMGDLHQKFMKIRNTQEEWKGKAHFKEKEGEKLQQTHLVILGKLKKLQEQLKAERMRSRSGFIPASFRSPEVEAPPRRYSGGSSRGYDGRRQKKEKRVSFSTRKRGRGEGYGAQGWERDRDEEERARAQKRRKLD